LGLFVYAVCHLLRIEVRNLPVPDTWRPGDVDTVVRMIRRTAAPALALALTFTLAACGGADQPESDAKGEQNETAQAEPGQNEDSKAKKSKDQEPTEVDLTADLRSAAGGKNWAGHVAGATETKPGRLSVETDLADRRGKKGRPAERQALKVCEAAVRLLEENGTEKPRVYVMDKDQTLFAVAGHPGFPDGCSAI